MVGLGGCPVAVTVYPPGRGCLHSALLTQSPGCVVYSSTLRELVHAERCNPATRRLPRGKKQAPWYYWSECVLGGILVAVGSPWRHICFNPPPPQRKGASPLRNDTGDVVHARYRRGEVEMAACYRRGYIAAE